jgi:hypothetical protein
MALQATSFNIPYILVFMLFNELVATMTAGTAPITSTGGVAS